MLIRQRSTSTSKKLKQSVRDPSSTLGFLTSQSPREKEESQLTSLLSSLSQPILHSTSLITQDIETTPRTCLQVLPKQMSPFLLCQHKQESSKWVYPKMAVLESILFSHTRRVSTKWSYVSTRFNIRNPHTAKQDIKKSFNMSKHPSNRLDTIRKKLNLSL